MKESRFIELLNLYVDHHLTPEEALELETELQGNSVRRRTYQQYCRMQRACSVLFETERERAPISPTLAGALAAASDKIVEFPVNRPRWPRAASTIGLLAAAACATFLLVRREATELSPGPALAVTPSVPPPAAPAPVLASTALPAGAPASEPIEFRPVMMVRSLVARPLSGAEPTLLSQREAAPFEWMEGIQLSALRPAVPTESLVFETPSGLEPERRSRPAPVTGDMEMTAFQFQR